METRPFLIPGLVLLCVLCAVPMEAEAQLRLDAGLSLSRFEQQVKTEIGGARGERLVEETEIGLLLMGSYELWEFLSIGGFIQFDSGVRTAGRFEAFNEDNEPIIVGQVGGGFAEFWAGPMLRLRWKTLFAELGYGAFGVRSDEGRTDLVTASGDDDSSLRTSQTVAWLMAAGAGVPLTDNLQAVLRVEYRIRYYDRRDDEKLVDQTVHGTQNITPFVGVAWSLDL